MRISAVPGESNPTTRRVVLFFLRIAISAAALWLAFGSTDWGEIAQSMAAAGPLPIAMTLGVYLAGQGVSAIRWLLIARSLGFVLRLSTAVRYYFIGMFFNFLGPSLLGGDVVRSLYLGRSNDRVATAAATVAFDRYVGFVWLAVMGSLAQIVFGSFALPPRLVLATHVLAIVAVSSWVLLPVIAARRIPSGLFRVRSMTSAISIAFHLIQIGGAVVLVHAVSPTTPWRYCFVFHPLVAIAAALPISIAGLGVRESGYVYFLASLQGASESHAGAFAAAWLAVVTAASAIGGLVFLVSGGRLPRGRADVGEGDHSTQFPASS